MRYSILCIILFFSIGAVAQNYYMLVGTYTGTGSKGIYVYNFNAETGRAKWVSNTDSVITNPSYLTAS
ncbi:MAG: beta-propeller fold lactonase family protein, partial [Ginsengibacter sp.]